MDIPSKNNNQPSVSVNVPPNKVSNRSFNSKTVKYHVSTNNKDVGIPNKKDVDIPKEIDVYIPQNKDVNISTKNNNQSSVPVKVLPNKVSYQSFISKIVKYHVSTNIKDVGITNNKDVDISKKIYVDIPQNKDMNIPSVHANIPPSQTNKPNYKPCSMYHSHNIVRRKLTLKINDGNEKDSFNVTLHKMRWKSIFDKKNIFGAEFQIYI